jgi:3-deoxy-D-manno-octulosonic-acid transferase
LDFSWAVKSALRRVRPDVLVLAELELWPNLIRAAKRQGVKTAVVNGRLSEKSFRGYRRIRPLVGRMLRQLDLIAVQDETYAGRFRELGALPETVHVTGSMKYDGAETDRQNRATRRLAELAGITDRDVVFLAGSTQEPEESAALTIFQRLHPEFPNLKLILVPRHPERFDSVAKLLDQSGLPWQRRTLLDQPTDEKASENSTFRLPPSAFLIDAVGELGAWWGTAQIAFVGGSFGHRGGQNMIEPAAYGAAVSFGPNTWNFRDVVSAMLDRQAAVVVQNPAELEQFVRRCLTDSVYGEELGRRAQEFVKTQIGATERTLRLLEKLA